MLFKKKYRYFGIFIMGPNKVLTSVFMLDAKTGEIIGRDNPKQKELMKKFLSPRKGDGFARYTLPVDEFERDMLDTIQKTRIPIEDLPAGSFIPMPDREGDLNG